MARTKQHSQKVTKKPAKKVATKTARKSTGIAKKSASNEDGNVVVKKKTYRHKPGTIAMRQVRKYQKSTNLLVSRKPLCRMIKEVTPQDTNVKFKKGAIFALHEALETFLVGLLEDALRCTYHAKRVTVMDRDVNLVCQIKYEELSELTRGCLA